MNPQRYQEICDLFSNVLERSPAARKSALDRVCVDDVDLRREVEAMLAADAQPLRLESFPAADLRAALQDGTETKLAPVSSPPMPDRIGHYAIRRVIASGGMGVVYEAVQEQPHRTVALKVLRSGIASPSTLRRFEYESQILARLRHPHIAQVYEAGTHEEGTDTVPYFAMEYIPNAKTLLQYAAEKKLDHRQRLELFAQVCDAVHHGHQKGIIHRDLKPGNILVDSAGEPKIIDFGVARATDSDMAVTTLHTDVGQLIGTLQYMSPEQCEADPHDLDSRSDVYALGVVLYELLCGQLPYDISGAPIPEAVRIIREHTPARPSTIVRRLRGDIETIVLKALAKDRDRRYGSAAQLADDIRRYLHDEPILARPPSTFYQFSKFARRNRVLVGSATVVLVALVAAVAVSTTYAISESRQARIAEEVNAFLRRDVLAFPNPMAGRTEPTVHTMLDEASKKIEGRFEDELLIEASIRLTLGITYRSLGEHGPAEFHLARAHDLLRAELGNEHKDTLYAKYQLGEILWRRARYVDAERLFAEVLALGRRVLGEDDPLRLRAMRRLGMIHRNLGHYGQAEALLVEALARQCEVLGEDHPNPLSTMVSLAGLYQREGRLEKAERLRARVLDGRRRVLGEDHPLTAEALNDLGTVYRLQGRYQQAEPLILEGLQRRRRLLGEEHQDTLWSLGDLGRLYLDQRRYEDAEPPLVKLVELRRRILGTDHPETGDAVGSLGRLYLNQRRYDEAEPLLVESLEIERRVLGDDHPDTLIAIHNMGRLMRDLGRLEEAEALGAEAARGARAKLAPSHPFRFGAIASYGRTLAAMQRFAEGEAQLLEAYEGFSRIGDDKRMSGAAKVLVELYTGWHEAEPDKGYDAKAAEWKSKLGSANGAAVQGAAGSDPG